MVRSTQSLQMDSSGLGDVDDLSALSCADMWHTFDDGRPRLWWRLKWAWSSIAWPCPWPCYLLCEYSIDYVMHEFTRTRVHSGTSTTMTCSSRPKFACCGMISARQIGLKTGHVMHAKYMHELCSLLMHIPTYYNVISCYNHDLQ
jgi:hypothetical protein